LAGYCWNSWGTVNYGTSAVYALRPISEEMAKDHWAARDPRPVRPATYREGSQIEDHSDDYDDEDPY